MDSGGRLFAALVVDDDCEVRRMMCTLLQDSGFKCLQAANADEGLSLVHDRQPAVGIFDILMPGTDGLDLARQVRHLYPGTHLVAVTAYSERWSVDDYLAAGFDGVFTKPFDCEKFRRYCEEIRCLLESTPG